MADGQEPVFDFMVVRSPDSIPSDVLHRRYIHDDALVASGTRILRTPRDLHTAGGSPVGRKVYMKVYCAGPEADDDPEEERLRDLIDSLLLDLPPYADPCAPPPTYTTRGKGSSPPFPFETLEQHTWVTRGNATYVLPDRLERLTHLPLVPELIRAGPLLEWERSELKLSRLLDVLRLLFGSSPGKVVFTADGAHTDEFRQVKAGLFDTLYLLYVLCRIAPTLNLEHVIDGLRTLHVLEALAIDEVMRRVSESGRPTDGDRALLMALAEQEPALRGWDLKSPIPGFPLLDRTVHLADRLDALPIIHPLFARLFRYPRPFNDIRYIGVGDLKVVRQWLTAYWPGEISHIHNVLKGETKTRDHRRLEKTQETFSFSGTTTEETTKENQTTERYEVKREVEEVVKSALGVTANANVNYNGGTVIASLGAGFSFNRSSDETTKTSNNFARDVINKAVERVEKQTVTQRATIKLFETEEKNLQVFSNTGEKASHTSGIYRWVDKEYTAQVFTYGKRLMYEFLVPEPAAFWAQSRLRSYADTLVVPQPPAKKPDRPRVDLGFTWQDVPERYGQLSAQYDLRDLPRPEPLRRQVVRDADTRQTVFADDTIDQPMNYSVTYNCHVEGAGGYRVTRAVVSGFFYFHHHANDQNPNGLSVMLNHRLIDHREHNINMEWPNEYWDVAPQEYIVFSSDESTLQFRFLGEPKKYNLRVDLEMEPDPETMRKWQHAVYDTVYAAELKKEEVRYERELAGYESELAEYRDRIDQVKATAVAEILQGGASAANKALMDEEIKKHCLTLITKEFDSDESDDLLTGSTMDPMKTRKEKPEATWFEVKENQGADGIAIPPTKASFKTGLVEEFTWPAIAIDAARSRGRIVQFLEQAFEWHRISYLFYPYFWAELPRWVELMNRADDADPDFTAFLRAGMARVLVAVTPAYEHAVMHYLATRQPWGPCGKAPVIGDPLFLPLYNEVRKQTDDRLGGEPDGEPWTYTVPTTLVYLHDSGDKLPDLAAEREARQKQTAKEEEP